MADFTKSLQELEHDDWGEPPFNSHLVRSVHAFRRIPLRELSVEQLRLLIGQQVGLSYLLPLALEQLQREPFSEGDCYKGDLLYAVLTKTPKSYWKQEVHARKTIQQVIQHALLSLNGVNTTTRKLLEPILHTANQQMQTLGRGSDWMDKG